MQGSADRGASAPRIEDYGLIGDTHTGALVGRDGSVDWLPVPRFDSGACFAALLGGPENGRWLLAPQGDYRAVGRRYRPGTLVLETHLASSAGEIRVVDCMPIRGEQADLVRRVEGVRGRVPVRSEIAVRFDYGHVLPWVSADGRRVCAFAGPDRITLDADVPHQAGPRSWTAEFEVGAGEAVDFRFAWNAARQELPPRLDVGAAIEATQRWWRDWSRRCTYRGDYREAVIRSLVTLKAMTYAPSGGIVAAPTTSLPEWLGGTRNWDYRYCWIRDATFTLLALLAAGYTAEAVAWREWLIRAVAGEPGQMQLMYGVDGERRLPEIELPWLPGYANSRPVRAGNAASEQFQLDVYGELMDALHQARVAGQPPDEGAWHVQRALMDFLEGHWQEPDSGIWEMRGPRRHFTHSKVMAWVAADRAVAAVERFGLDGPADKWKQLRQDIHDEVCQRGYDAERGTFTQYYGSSTVDAALLLMAHVGFLPPIDPRLTGTVAAIEAELTHDGLVRRYHADDADGLPAGEGTFLPCSFWLADNYTAQGRLADARRLLDRLLGLRNDLGLLAEEYDPERHRQLGNFPQALSHLALVNTAVSLTDTGGAVYQRRCAAGG